MTEIWIRSVWICMWPSILLQLWKRMWRFKLPNCVNFALQTSHVKERSPVWTTMCRFNAYDFTNSSEQTSHMKGCSPVCMYMSRFKLPNCVNFALQTSHVKERSPVWTTVWSFNACDVINFLQQTSHTEGCSPVWMSVWHCKLKRRFKLHSWKVRNRCECACDLLTEMTMQTSYNKLHKQTDVHLCERACAVLSYLIS